MAFVGRIFRAPLGAKVAEAMFAFWVLELLSTAGVEATSDFSKTDGNRTGGTDEDAKAASNIQARDDAAQPLAP